MDKSIEMRFMHWVYIDGVKFFGPGRAELLSHIKDTGSIAKAAKVMGMSYKKAWRLVDEMNTLGKGPYVIAQKGGANGGGTELTERAENVIEAYNRLTNKLQAVIREEEKTLAQLV